MIFSHETRVEAAALKRGSKGNKLHFDILLYSKQYIATASDETR